MLSADTHVSDACGVNCTVFFDEQSLSSAGRNIAPVIAAASGFGFCSSLPDPVEPEKFGDYEDEDDD